MTATPTLSVKNLRKRIGNKEIIKGLSFDVFPGEVFGFLGPNGAGKTTTIRMLVGLIKPTSGTVLIDGKNVQTEFAAAMRSLGCIVENPEPYPYLTGWENLEYVRRMDPSISKKRIAEMADLTGLTNRMGDKVRTYSLGMRQRLGIAQALLGHPRLLILDEPTNGLDPAGIREIREFIRRLAQEKGLSVLVSSHLLGEIQILCDRVSIITAGRMIRTDRVDTLLTEQARIVWKTEPAGKAKKILQAETDVSETGDHRLITPYDEDKTADWNKKLVEAGVRVHGIETRLPSLEDLFLKLTGDASID